MLRSVFRTWGISCKLAGMPWVIQGDCRVSQASLCHHLTLRCHRMLTMLTGKPVVWDKHHKDGFLYPNLSIFFPSTWVAHGSLLPPTTCNTLHVMLHSIFCNYVFLGSIHTKIKCNLSVRHIHSLFHSLK